MRGGYDYQFVDSLPERLICKICLLPSRDPCLSVCCGHTFCKECANATWNVVRACPMCRNEKFPVVVNKQSDREIRSLCVVCTNKGKGCEWQGELNDINTHLESSDGCQFQEVKCSNKCGKILQQRYLTNHLRTECPRRKVGCFYCHAIGEYQFIMGKHGEQCPKLPLPCPNNCEVGSIPREDMKKHAKVCKLQNVVCIKCKKTLQRQYLISHVKTVCPYRIVDCLYCCISGEHQFIRSWQHRKVCPKLPLPCPNKCEVRNVPREDMEAHRKECSNEMVQCEYHNVGCDERLMRKDMEKHIERTQISILTQWIW